MTPKSTLPRLWLALAALLVLADLLRIGLAVPLYPASSERVFLAGAALAMLLFAQLLPNRTPANHVAWATLVMALTLWLIACGKGQPPGDNVMLIPLSAQLFFFSRPLSIGLCLLAALTLLTSRDDKALTQLGRWYALVAGIAFLGGEIVGSFWSFYGWGRTWSWSAHFFFSALVYLLLILVFHLPKRWLGRERDMALAQAALVAAIALTNLGYKLW
ncbi:hypothetical protein KUV56_01110 [Ferrimonas balearica]|uniref:hypothetical protein n=1 Tax=Ferrimonas balearica TaxID=44012 RepID=UPI001C575A76|nr:hypothetical protein [Ferrimonas balearica]MBW3138120.1 hypothetical protein [Ferrimonas balearica]